MMRGSCLCGDVAFETSGTPMGVFHCHCSRCRKVRGTAHATNMRLPFEGFRYLRGEDQLTTFRAPGARYFSHVFCRTCGSSMPRVDEERGMVILPMGSLDDDPPPFEARHIHVASKASWETITDDLPRDDAGPANVSLRAPR